MDFFSNLIAGLSVTLQPLNLTFCFLGVFIGTLIGVLPGIGPVGTMAILFPVTYKIPPISAIIMLAGIYYGAMYGGSTTSILLNLPGEAASVVTCIDGYKMAQKGRAGAALGIAAIGSFVAGVVVGIVVRGDQFVESIVVGDKELKVDGLFIEVGLNPGSKITEGLGITDASGRVVVNSKCATSKPGFFAAGSYDRKGFGRFTEDRFKRLVIPTLINMVAIMPFIEIVELGNSPTGFNLIGFLSGIGVMWFTAALFGFSLIYGLVRLMLRRPAADEAERNQLEPTFTVAVMLILTIAIFAFLIRIIQPIWTNILSFQIYYFASYIVLFSFGKFNFLGWKGRGEHIHPKMTPGTATDSQRATIKYFVVVGLLFLAQVLVGGATAHYRAEPGNFYGINLSTFFPSNIFRTWHLQLAIFWIATAYVAGGLFLGSSLGGKEPKGQVMGINLLFFALLFVCLWQFS
jgi:hypothetical protein